MIALESGARHVSGHSECGAKGSYCLPPNGAFVFETLVLPEPGRYRFGIELHGGEGHGLIPLRLEVDGASYDVPLEFDYKPGAWQESRHVRVPLGARTHQVRLVASGGASMDVEEVELDEVCAEAPELGACGEPQEMDACLDKSLNESRRT